MWKNATDVLLEPDEACVFQQADTRARCGSPVSLPVERVYNQTPRYFLYGFDSSSEPQLNRSTLHSIFDLISVIMGPWSFWMSRANSEPLPGKSQQDSNVKSPLAESPETSWSAENKIYATSAPGGWDQQPEPQSYIIQPDDSAYQPFGRALVLNRMDSPLQEADDSVSSIIRGVHEEEMRELVAVIKELREQAARDAEFVAELRGQAEENAGAIGLLRIENERLMKELSAAASEARAAAAAAVAAATTAAATAAAIIPPPHSPPPHSLLPHSPPPRSLPLHNPPPRSPPPHSPPAPPKTDEEKKTPKQAPHVSTPSSPKTTPTAPPIVHQTHTNPSSSTVIPQPTPSSPNLLVFETYDRMINLLKTKPRPDIQLGDYPWPMLPEPAGSFPQRITLRSDVKKEKVFAFVQEYASLYGRGRRKERGEAMVKAWQSVMSRSGDPILNGTAARAFTYMDMATRSL